MSMGKKFKYWCQTLSLSVESYAVAICPKCKKREVLPRIYAPALHRNIKYVAIKHSDHVFIVGFDRFGVVRTTNSYDYYFGTSQQNNRCPKCGRLIPLVLNEGKPYAINHGDHIVVAFPIGKKIAIEIYDVINPLRIFPKPSLIKKIVREIGREALAEIFYEIYVDKRKEFIVPPVVHEDLRKLIKDVFKITIKLRSGPVLKKYNPLAKYFERAIAKAENLTYLEGVSILKDSIEVLDGLYESLNKIKNIHGYKKFCEELNRVKEGDEYVYYVLRSMFHIKC